MDANTCRRLNIRYLADHKYSRNFVAEKLGYIGTNYINQLCGGFGSFGSRTARKIETVIGLPKGWMDAPHPDLYSIRDLAEGLDIAEEEITGAQETPGVGESKGKYSITPDTSPEEEELLQTLRAASPEEREYLMQIFRIAAQRGKTE